MDNAPGKLMAIPLADRRTLASVTSDSIRSQDFSVVLRGFSPTEVRRYLAQVAQWVDGFKREIIQLTSEPSPASPVNGETADPYGDLGARMADVLRSVDTHAKELRREVEDEAKRRLEEARKRAEQIEAEAEAEAARVRREAIQSVQELVERRDSLVTELKGLLELTGTITGLLQRDLAKVGRSGPGEVATPPDAKPAAVGAGPEFASTHYGRS